MRLGYHEGSKPSHGRIQNELMKLGEDESSPTTIFFNKRSDPKTPLGKDTLSIFKFFYGEEKYSQEKSISHEMDRK
jgi:hypothetical protein